ncbi:MAG TPA: hypothetical protein VGB17_03895 [Pyrinomonadaceae bacterium]
METNQSAVCARAGCDYFSLHGLRQTASAFSGDKLTKATPAALLFRESQRRVASSHGEIPEASTIQRARLSRGSYWVM